MIGAETVESIEKDVRERLAHKRGRLAHSLSVADTCESLARAYSVDPALARVAGLLHDWDKALSKEEQVEKAVGLGIDLGVDPWLAQPLLHGMTAAATLPERYPGLPVEVWDAIRVHTSGAARMSPLAMVLFVADGIEPLRPASPGIELVRGMVGESTLEDLFWESFRGGLTYVIDGGRYLYPGTIDVYNKIALARTASAGMNN